MEFLAEYGAFLLKALTIVVAILLVVAGIAAAGSKGKGGPDGKIVVNKLNDDLDEFKETLEESLLSKDELKKQHKQKEKQENLLYCFLELLQTAQKNQSQCKKQLLCNLQQVHPKCIPYLHYQ